MKQLTDSFFARQMLIVTKRKKKTKKFRSEKKFRQHLPAANFRPNFSPPILTGPEVDPRRFSQPHRRLSRSKLFWTLFE